MFRIPLLAVSLLTALCAVFVAGHSMWAGEGSGLFLAVKLVACLAVIGAAIVTWAHALSKLRTLALPLLLVGMGLLALGGFAVAWSVHMGFVTGDPEGGPLLLNAIIVAQGALTVVSLWHGNERGRRRA